MTETDGPFRPSLHHVNLKTTRLDEMIDWYRTVVGLDVVHRYPLGAWLSNDDANHRLALLSFPGYRDDPDREAHAGLLHSAFEYPSLDQLLGSYERLKAAEITPFMCLDHGMTLSFYYADPDANAVELQVDNFGDWLQSKQWMRDSDEFHADPLGTFVDPDQVVEARRSGRSAQEIHAGARAGAYLPDPLPAVPMPTAPD